MTVVRVQRGAKTSPGFSVINIRRLFFCWCFRVKLGKLFAKLSTCCWKLNGYCFCIIQPLDRSRVELCWSEKIDFNVASLVHHVLLCDSKLGVTRFCASLNPRFLSFQLTKVTRKSIEQVDKNLYPSQRTRNFIGFKSSKARSIPGNPLANNIASLPICSWIMFQNETTKNQSESSQSAFPEAFINRCGSLMLVVKRQTKTPLKLPRKPWWRKMRSAANSAILAPEKNCFDGNSWANAS